MRKIEFLAPVEAMRGNLSGSQRLTYPTQNNRAWDSPSNKRNYATNYGTRYIGNKRAMNGKKFFAVKTKTAVTMSPKMREQQAVLSVGSVMANIIMGDLRTLVRLQELFKISPEISQGWSFKRWISVYTREGLKNKRHIVFPTTGSQAAIIFVNPYISTAAPSQAYDVSEFFPVDLLVKFWTVLSNGGVTFRVGYQTGVAFPTQTWSQLIADSAHNILGLVVVDNLVCQEGSTAEKQVQLCYDYSGLRNNIKTSEQIGETLAEDPDKSALYWYEVPTA